MNTIEWSAKAVRQLRKIAEKRKRQGRDDYRLRVGDHRVIFAIDQSGTPIIVTIMQVEKRNERTY